MAVSEAEGCRTEQLGEHSMTGQPSEVPEVAPMAEQPDDV
jgi:hypothetical protein